jgi:hypothetical protein
MTSARDNLTLTLHLENETRESILVRLPNSDGAPVFLPVSQIAVAPERAGRLLMVTLPRWLAESKGLIAKPDPNQTSLF